MKLYERDNFINKINLHVQLPNMYTILNFNHQMLEVPYQIRKKKTRKKQHKTKQKQKQKQKTNESKQLPSNQNSE